MATYPVVNTKTGDKREVTMSVHDWDQWCADNPEWSRDYSDPSTCPMAAEVENGEINYVNQSPE